VTTSSLVNKLNISEVHSVSTFQHWRWRPQVLLKHRLFLRAYTISGPRRQYMLCLPTWEIQTALSEAVLILNSFFRCFMYTTTWSSWCNVQPVFFSWQLSTSSRAVSYVRSGAPSSSLVTGWRGALRRKYQGQ